MIPFGLGMCIALSSLSIYFKNDSDDKVIKKRWGRVSIISMMAGMLFAVAGIADTLSRMR